MAIAAAVFAFVAAVYTLVGAFSVELKMRVFVVGAPVLSACAVFMSILATGWKP